MLDHHDDYYDTDGSKAGLILCPPMPTTEDNGSGPDTMVVLDVE